MKAVILMYLEDDSKGVEKLLSDHDVVAYSEMSVEGHGLGAAGWYGEVAPYRSRMLLAFLSAAKADELLLAVGECDGCVDRSHPIHAWMVDVEKSVTSGASARTGDNPRETRP